MRVNISYTRISFDEKKRIESITSYWFETDCEHYKKRLKKEFSKIIDRPENIVCIHFGMH